MKLLERLINTPGVPGREDRIRAVIEEHVRAAGIFDEIRTDALGSLIGVRRPRPRSRAQAGAPVSVLAAAHMDQIGFLVRHISSEGFLALHPVGAFDPRTLFGHRVRVCTEGGEDLPGIINAPGRPIHTATPEELKLVPDLSTFFVDLSLPHETVRDKVRLGDMVVLDAPFLAMGQSIIGGGLDNRVGCWALIRALEAMTHHDCTIYAVWSVQEELGSRGAVPASFGIEADIGLSCDTTVCCKVPGVPAEQQVTLPGEGVSLQIADSSTLADMSLVRDLETVARAKGIRSQRSLMLGGGQDGAAIQRSRRGVRTIVLSCPVKYMHSAVEMVHRDDLDSYRSLIAAYLESM